MARLRLHFVLLGDARSCYVFMAGSIYFLHPYAREEKTHLDVMGIELGEIAPQPNSLSITPWPLRQELRVVLRVFLLLVASFLSTFLPTGLLTLQSSRLNYLSFNYPTHLTLFRVLFRL